jgi:2-oxoglutarate dehydrogenase E2 component (dihydrolipoamide succinyltransferase)
MALVELIMPKLGESIMEATILKWHKKPGDAVNEDDTVLDIATDKVDSEIPSPVKGVIEEILYQENDIVHIGKVIAIIRVGEGINIAQKDIPPSNEDNLYKEEPIEMEVPYYPPSESETFKKSFDNDTVRFYSPLVINIAQQEGISMAELENIVGTGQDGRVSKKDILTYVASKSNQLNLDNSNSSQNSNFKSEVNYLSKEEIISPVSINYDSKANVEIIEMDRMRKLISHHMVESQNTSAHVTSFAECDVTNMVHWREKIKKDFESRIGEKITFTPLFIEAIVKSIKKYPLLSSSVVGDKIIIKKNLNIGMATSLPDGNLIVPVIKNADQLNLVGLIKQVNGLANAARSGKLRPDDTTDGTFTLTNIGTFGSIMGTPIINQPQVAIMAIGVIKKRPMVIETSHGDSIAIRHMIYVSLSYDHRIIDGSLGSTFLNEVVKELENFDINRNY